MPNRTGEDHPADISKIAASGHLIAMAHESLSEDSFGTSRQSSEVTCSAIGRLHPRQSLCLLPSTSTCDLKGTMRDHVRQFAGKNFKANEASILHSSVHVPYAWERQKQSALLLTVHY
eukprot:5161181-Amphidinium_carterae.1